MKETLGTSTISESSEKSNLSYHRKWIKQQKRTLLLLVLLTLYSVIGALIFKYLERDVDDIILSRIEVNKRAALKELQLGLKNDVDPRNWTRMAEKLMEYYIEDMMNAIEHGVDLESVQRGEPITQWDFWGSLLYAGTLFTTIGNSRATPAYQTTRLITIIYSVIGVPLCLLALAETGRLISKMIRHSVKRLKQYLHPDVKSRHSLRECWPKQTEIDSLAGSSALCVYGSICTIYLLVGAMAMNFAHLDEDASFLDDIYYLFGAASTIGFGHSIGGHPVMIVSTCLYTFLGLSIISTGFAILQERFEAVAQEAKHTVLGQNVSPSKSESHAVVNKPESFETVKQSEKKTDGETKAAEQMKTEQQKPEVVEETITAAQAGTVTAGVMNDWSVDAVDARVIQNFDNTDVTVEATIILE